MVMLLFVFWEEVMAAPAQRRHESQEEYRFRISSAEEKARILHRQRVAAGEVPPPEGRGPGTHPGYERDFPPSLPPEPGDPSIQGTQSPVEMAIWWGPIAAQLAKLGYSTASRELLKRRLVKDASGKPQPFYHGTRGRRKGDLDPTQTKKAKETGKPQQDFSTSPETADTYALGGWGYRLEEPLGARVYKKYLRRLRGKDPGVHFTHLNWRGEPMRRIDWQGNPLPGGEYWARVTDAKAMVPPYAIAPPPLPNFLPRLAPPAIGTQR